ncbi:MAG: hypothetical protein ACKOA1_02580 [Bacteroidota bacterium]
MYVRSFVAFIYLILNASVCNAQEDYSWWNTIHDWDGITPWNLYMKISPSYFGPNALPVPELRDGSIDTLIRFETAVGVHFSEGDHTYDSRLRLSIPVVKGKVVLESSVVPLEFYQMDSVTRDLRAARDRDGKGRAGGDIIFTTRVVLMRGQGIKPDISFEASFRTASGTQLGAARYTDAPGYWFSLSTGRDFKTAGRFIIRPYVTAGFYAFQTYDLRRLQDDCLLWGSGVDLKGDLWCWSVQLTGYVGHNDNGDRPALFRSYLRRQIGSWSVQMRYQEGLHDFGYRSFHIGIIKSWKFSKIKKEG